MKRKIFLYAGLLLMGIMGALSSGVVRAADTDIVIEATATEASQTLAVTKYFANDYMVDRGDGSPIKLVSSSITHKYDTASDYTITLSLTGGADRWTFGNTTKPLIPGGATTVTGVKIVSMPSLADGFGESATNPGDYFFAYFNYNGKLTSLPDGSFDTSNITTAGDYFFAYFNYNGKLTSLPAGSFDISNITTAGDNFFHAFNYGGELTSLPAGSFDISNITTAGDYFFLAFNYGGELTSLPAGSFDTSNITTAGDNFFLNFNGRGALESLPVGSFDTSNITTAGDYFFAYFNYNGKLTSLPAGSFDTSNITTVGDNFFTYFNYGGELTSLPDGSFDTSKITTAGDYFFNSFNFMGGLTNLPASFKLTSAAYNKNRAYRGAFNSPSYTLNRKVSDLVAGITPPTSDMDTFSDNQPGRCGVHENWLVNEPTEDQCIVTVTFDVNGGNERIAPITGNYNEPITAPTEPTRASHRFLHRYLSGDNENNAFNFSTPITGDITLVAQWKKKSSSTGGGGGSSSSSETNTGSTTNTGSNNTNTGSTNTGTTNTGTTLTGDTQDSSDKSSEGQSGYSQEFLDAYNFAFQNGITTMPTIDQADMTGNLTRIQMAKMLSYYAINIMGKKPDETRNNKFNDVSEKLNSDYNSGVTLAYQLGIMGINMPNNNFRPNDLVTRGEFVTALSRMIYGTKDGEYEGTSKYYTKHIEKLNEEEIIKQIDPSMKELRAYVMIMLKRASEK